MGWEKKNDRFRTVKLQPAVVGLVVMKLNCADHRSSIVT